MTCTYILHKDTTFILSKLPSIIQPSLSLDDLNKSLSTAPFLFPYLVLEEGRSLPPSP